MSQNPPALPIFQLCVIIVLLLLIVGVPLGSLLRSNYKVSNEQLQAFKTHFAPLSEVQEIYNISTLYSDWPTFRGAEDISWSRIGSQTPPQSLLELTTNLLLKSVQKQHALESEVKTLGNEVETLRLYFLFSLGFVATFVLQTIWRLESKKSA